MYNGLMIAGLVLLLIGALLLILGIVFFIVGGRIWNYDCKTTGRVVDMCLNAYGYNNGGNGNVSGFGISTGAASSGMRCPIFEYIVNGVVYRCAGNTSYNIGHINKMMNKPVEVYYRSSEPGKATISKKSPLRVVGAVFIPCAVLILAVAAVLMIVGVR